MTKLPMRNSEEAQLLKLQQKHGFRMLAIGDPRQGGAIDPEVIDLLLKTMGDKVPQILTSVRQNTAREREIAGLFRDGKANEAIAMKLEDRTAELVAGGRDATVQRIAARWMDLTEADPTLKPTIGTANNRDAHDIGVAIRKRLQETGAIGPDKIPLNVLRRDEAGEHPMPLAVGDKVRVFNRVWVDGHFASNGDVLEVLDVSERGMTARNEDGRDAFVPWGKLQGRFDLAPRAEVRSRPDDRRQPGDHQPRPHRCDAIRVLAAAGRQGVRQRKGSVRAHASKYNLGSATTQIRYAARMMLSTVRERERMCSRR